MLATLTELKCSFPFLGSKRQDSIPQLCPRRYVTSQEHLFTLIKICLTVPVFQEYRNYTATKYGQYSRKYRTCSRKIHGRIVLNIKKNRTSSTLQVDIRSVNQKYKQYSTKYRTYSCRIHGHIVSNMFKKKGQTTYQK